MALLDFIKNHNAQQAATPSVASLPAEVKAQAVEAARPAAEIMGKGAEPKDAPVQPPVSNAPSRGRGLGWER